MSECFVSPGQLRVRQIAQSILDDHKNVKAPEHDRDIQDELMEAIQKDPVITTDPVTSQPADYYSMSENGPASVQYFNWLSNRSWPVSRDFASLPSKFDTRRIILQGSVAERWQPVKNHPLYKAGHRPNSVAYSILSLQQGIPLDVKDMHINYYKQHNVAMIYAGNHRMAGYKLTGYTDFPKTTLYTYHDTPFSDVLDKSLIKLMETFPELSPDLINSLKNPSAERMDFLAESFAGNKDLARMVQVIKGRDNELSCLNLVADAYNACVVNRTKSIWEKCGLYTHSKPFVYDDVSRHLRKQPFSAIEDKLEGPDLRL